MRTLGVILAASVLLTGCTDAPRTPPEISPAASAAAASEFTINPAGQRAAFPDWTTKDLDGYDWNTGNLRHATTVVNFWASWCQPCVDEWPELQAAAAGHPSIGFIGIDTMDYRADARRFLSDHGSDYRHLVDADAWLLHHLEGIPSTTLPTTLILDAERRVAAWKVGPVSKGQIRRALAQIASGA